MRKQSPKNIVCVLLTLFFVAAFSIALAAGASDTTTVTPEGMDISDLVDGSFMDDLLAQATSDTPATDGSDVAPTDGSDVATTDGSDAVETPTDINLA